MNIIDSQKQKIEELNEKLDKLFSDYQRKAYRLAYSFHVEDEGLLEKALDENYKKFLGESKIIQESAFNLLKSINKEEDENKLKELYDKINKQNGEN